MLYELDVVLGLVYGEVLGTIKCFFMHTEIRVRKCMKRLFYNKEKLQIVGNLAMKD